MHTLHTFIQCFEMKRHYVLLAAYVEILDESTLSNACHVCKYVSQSKKGLSEEISDGKYWSDDAFHIKVFIGYKQ